MLAAHLVRVGHVEKAQRFGGNTEAPARTVRAVLSNILGVVMLDRWNLFVSDNMLALARNLNLSIILTCTLALGWSPLLRSKVSVCNILSEVKKRQRLARRLGMREARVARNLE